MVLSQAYIRLTAHPFNDIHLLGADCRSLEKDSSLLDFQVSEGEVPLKYVLLLIFYAPQFLQ